MGLIPGSGRSPGGGHGNPLQCSLLENPMDRGTWRATVRRVAQSWTRHVYALFNKYMKTRHIVYFKIIQLRIFLMIKDRRGKTVLIRGPTFL